MQPAVQVVGEDRRRVSVRAAEGHESDDLAALLAACLAEFETQFPLSAWQAMRAERADAGHQNEVQVGGSSSGAASSGPPQFDHSWAVAGSGRAEGTVTLPALAYVFDV